MKVFVLRDTDGWNTAGFSAEFEDGRPRIACQTLAELADQLTRLGITAKDLNAESNGSSRCLSDRARLELFDLFASDN